MVESEIRLFLLVVLYNKSIKDSETLTSLFTLKEQLQEAKLLLWDNSPERSITSADLQAFTDAFTKVEYVSTPENLALSTIYNRVINRKDLNRYDALVLLDHDSVLSDNFFTEAKAGVALNFDINLFLPIVESNNQIVSPADLYMFKGVRWKRKRKGIIGTKWRTAINSGMCIRVSYLKHRFRGYDERLKFYGTDTFFMNSYASDNEHLFVLDTCIKHKLNYFEEEELDVKLQRFHEIKRSTSILNEHPLYVRALTEVYLIVFSFFQAIRFKSLRFIYDYKR